MKKVLFVCTGNTCRSVLAHYYAAAAAAGLPLEFGSAGLAADPDLPQPAHVRDLLLKENIKAPPHRPVPMTAALADGADLLLAMTEAQRERLAALYPASAPRTFRLADYAGLGSGDVPDPYGHGPDFYGDVFRLIRTAVDGTLAKLKKEVK